MSDEPNGTTDRTVTTTRSVDASPDAVWDALTSDDGFAAWTGDGATIDAVPGGHIHTPDSATGTERAGAVEHVEPPSELRYRWWPVDQPDEVSTVEVAIEPDGTQTTITVTEQLVLAPVVSLRARPQGPQLLAA